MDCVQMTLGSLASRYWLPARLELELPATPSLELDCATLLELDSVVPLEPDASELDEIVVRTVDERDAWFLDTKSVTDIVDVMNLLATLGLCRYRYHSRISKEQQLLILGYLGHCHMGEHMTGAHNSVFLV